MQEQLERVTALSNPLPEDLKILQENLQLLMVKAKGIEENLTTLEGDLKNPDKVTGLVGLGLHPALKQGIEKSPALYSKAIAPVITPAIRNQIRDSREEMVEALSPIIGQTIGKAIAEAFQDFRRRLDSQLKQNLNFRQRLKARMQGVSEADLMIRSSFPYTIRHVFLIHRQTGLLLKQVSLADDRKDMDLISGMLTAIRDFAKETFGQKEKDLEDIQFGNLHILIRTGQFAYLAAVVDGIHPPGFSMLLQNTAHEINVQHEDVLRNFQGDMTSLPDLTPELMIVLNPDLSNVDPLNADAESGNRGKKSIWPIVAGLIALLALLAFACVFSIRLLPAAFPPRTSMTFTPLPTYTHTPPPTNTATPMPTATNTPTPEPIMTEETYVGIMTGNVWAHEGADFISERIPLVVETNTKVQLKAVYNGWMLITWETAFGIQEGWVPQIYVGLPFPIPEELVTPVR